MNQKIKDYLYKKHVREEHREISDKAFRMLLNIMDDFCVQDLAMERWHFEFDGVDTIEATTEDIPGGIAFKIGARGFTVSVCNKAYYDKHRDDLVHHFGLVTGLTEVTDE